MQSLTYICKVCLKTVKRSNIAIFCDHCDSWIQIKCNNLDKLDYKIIKSAAELLLCTFSCTSNILPFCNRLRKAREKISTPASLFYHNKLFQLIKNLNNVTD